MLVMSLLYKTIDTFTFRDLNKKKIFILTFFLFPAILLKLYESVLVQSFPEL